MKDGTYDFGLIGLGVMGRNFMFNVADHGFSVIGHDLDTAKVDNLIKEKGNSSQVHATTDVVSFINALDGPRRVMLLVPAGSIVDNVIEVLIPYLNPKDIIIDGGNSHFNDTDRRQMYLAKKDIQFIGAGISGGAKGARNGPSIMPGGNKEAYGQIRPIFEAVAAKYKGQPCVAYLGPGSAGNYVKMVHNGIEYGLMQLSAEIFDVLKQFGGLDHRELYNTFSAWNKQRLQSFIVEISAKIFIHTEASEGGYLIDKIMDKAKQKGTGKWTSQNAMDLGVPVPTIDMAVSMRQLSSMKNEREQASKFYAKREPDFIDKPKIIELAEKALYFSFIITFAQGMHQLSEASKEYGYDLDLGMVANIWRGGCIIKARVLDDIALAYRQNSGLTNLLLAPTIVDKIRDTEEAVRSLVCLAINHGIPLPGISNAISYFDALRSNKLPLNLIQAQRDYFGSHTYERIDKEGSFHTNWEE